MNSGGVITSGSSSFSNGVTNSIFGGKMDASKTKTTVVSINNFGYRSITTAIKAGGVFSTSDLAGTWHIFTFGDDPSSNDPNWTRGTATVNSSGIVTGGSLVDSWGNFATITGGSLSMTADGVISGNIVNPVGGTAFISHGKADMSKAMAEFVGLDGGWFPFIGTVVKAGGAFSTPDLAGTWHIFTIGDDPFSNNPNWTRGTMTVNSSGIVTGGSFVDSDGVSATVIGGSLSLSGSGVMSGSLILSVGITVTISQGKMHSGKTTVAFVGTDSGSFRFKGSAIKAKGGLFDFDGDGKADIAVYNNGAWSIMRSSDGGTTVVGWGGSGWIPVPGDYDGDGKTDIAVYNNGAWSIRRSSDGGTTVVGWGGPGWVPARTSP